MICHKCKTQNQESRVHSLGGFKTLMGHQPYYDLNTITMGYRCTSGHCWSTKSKVKCLNCAYGAEEPVIEDHDDNHF